MKKCFLCAALLCLVLCACATATQSPATTTTPQTNATTTNSTATTVPTTNNNSTATTVPPTTRPPTKPVIYTDYKCMYGDHVYQYGNCIYCGRKQAAGDVGATQPTTASTPTIDPSIAHGVRVICGDQMIVPEEAFRGGRFWTSAGWVQGSGMGIMWQFIDLNETPVITLDDTITIEKKPDAAFNEKLRVQKLDGEDLGDIEVSLVHTLPSGVYMVKFGVTFFRGAEMDGGRAFDAYEYGFLLEIP